MYRTIRNRFRGLRSRLDISPRIIEVLSRQRMPKAVSVVIQIAVQRRNRKSPAAITAAQYPIWVLSKTGLNEDIAGALPPNGDHGMRVMRVTRQLTKGVTRAFLPCINDNDYPSAVASAPGLQIELRKFWADTLSILCKDTRIRLIIGGNWRYWGERDLAAAACACGIPFVVLHKECFKTEFQTRNALHAYRKAGRFEGSYVLTYNSHEKDLFVKAGVAEEDQIIVTGAPRFDALHELRKTRARRNTSALHEEPKLVCFAVSPHAGLAVDPAADPAASSPSPSSWLDLCKECLSVWHQVAIQRPNIALVVKVKVGDANTRPVQDWWRRRDIPSNMTLEVGGVATRVLSDANAACGFNTTALLDALACGLPVGLIRYGSAGSASSDLLHDYAGLGAQLTDLEATLRWVDDAVLAGLNVKPDLDVQAQKLLEEYVGNGDGCAGLRVRAALSRVMDLHSN